MTNLYGQIDQIWPKSILDVLELELKKHSLDFTHCYFKFYIFWCLLFLAFFFLVFGFSLQIFLSFFGPFYPQWIPPWSGRGKSDCNSLWVSLWRLELWTIPNNWRTNCPQTYRREESTVQKDVERLLHKKKFRAKINFHSHNSILSWAKIATQKKSKRLKKKKRKTLFSHCKPAEFAGICDPAGLWLVGWKWPLTFSKVDSNESFHFVLIT